MNILTSNAHFRQRVVKKSYKIKLNISNILYFFASQERDYQGSLGSPKFLTKLTINGAAL